MKIKHTYLITRSHIKLFSQSHLEMLRCALKEYIMDQNRSVIEQAIITLKEELDFDSNAINELHSAIYMFQEAVNAVLRMHSIKPHWMFALDNLVRNAVQAAITVLSPGKQSVFFCCCFIKLVS